MLVNDRGDACDVCMQSAGISLWAHKSHHTQNEKNTAMLSGVKRPYIMMFGFMSQVGVCCEERLPGERGGHPVLGDHQAERCHTNQQL